MIEKYKRSIIIVGVLLLLNLGTPLFAGWFDGVFNGNFIKLNHNFTKQDIEDIGKEFKAAMPELGKELKESAEVFATQLAKHAPELTEQVKKSCDEINRTVKIMANPLKTMPLGGVGLASAVAGFVLLYKSLDAYCALEIQDYDGAVNATQKNERRAALKRALAGLALIAAGLVTIIKSDAIVNQFA